MIFDRGISVVEIARCLKITREYVSKYYNNAPKNEAKIGEIQLAIFVTPFLHFIGRLRP